MLAFILRRLAQSIVVMAVVALIAFMLFRYVGDPVASLLGQDSRLEDFEELRQRLGLNDPFYIQFLRFVGDALQGVDEVVDVSDPALEQVAAAMPARKQLGGVLDVDMR